METEKDYRDLLEIMSIMREIMRQVKEGELTLVELQVFMKHRDRFTKPSISFDNIRQILGNCKVITHNQTAKAWDIEIPIKAPIRYSEATLQECAEQNRNNEADWRLIYVMGSSLREQLEKRGTNAKNQPCFDKNLEWWFKPDKHLWVNKKPKAGCYYLINLWPNFGNMSWNDQEQAIFDLGNNYERCDLSIFTEAIQTILIVCDGERIAGSWYHWGFTPDADNFHACAGLNDKGIKVSGHACGNIRPNLCVSTVRKFNF